MEARIRFYAIEKCGYYKRNGRSLGTVSEILDNLQNWVNGKYLNETLCPVDSDTSEGDTLPTYCYSVVQRNGDYLLTTWNRTADVNGKIASIDGLGKTGEAKVETTKITDGYIPGYPSFFWFIPAKKVFASVKFNNVPLNGKKKLDEYLKGFLKYFSQYVVFDKTTGNEFEIKGYGTEQDYSYHPFFVAKEFTNKGDEDFIRKNRMNIYKIIKKDDFKHQRPETKELWQRIVCFIQGERSNEDSNCIMENKIRIEIDGTPSETELNNIINHWSQDCSQCDSTDIGFIFRGKSNHIVWLKQALASIKFDLDIRFVNNDVLVKPEDLLGELQKKQERIFKEVRYEQNNTIS